jgi:hypothetical protein
MHAELDGEYVEYVTARLPGLRRFAFLLCGDEHRGDDLVQADHHQAVRAFLSQGAPLVLWAMNRHGWVAGKADGQLRAAVWRCD